MKASLKSFLNGLALLSVLPLALGYRCGACCVGAENLFAGFAQLLSLIPGQTGVYLRRAFYRLTLPRCEAGMVASFGCLLTSPRTEIGAMAYIGPYCCLGEVTLENDVLIGSHVSITNGNRQHGIERLDIPVREQPGVWPRVMIGRDSWIGDRAVIMANVGEHCVVGAGAVVTKPVPDFAIVVGVPARIVGWRKDDQAASLTTSPASLTLPEH